MSAAARDLSRARMRRARVSPEAALSLRYECMASGEVPPSVIADWLREPLFAAYVARRRQP